MPARALPGSEAALARLWAAQHALGGELATVDGSPVQVLYPGRPGGAAGPDFRDAVIRFGSEPPRLGDVELHRTARDFIRHGHATDPAYNNVMLHVVFDADGVETTALASGRRAPVLTLHHGASSELPAREPCATATTRLGSEHGKAVLRDGGMWRLRQKQAGLAAAIQRDGEAQALYVALAAALGQTANVQPMTLLAGSARLEDVAQGIAAIPEAAAADLIAERLLHAAGLDGALLAPAPALPWVIFGVRPAAHPRRRILALAGIVARLSTPDPLTPFPAREGGMPCTESRARSGTHSVGLGLAATGGGANRAQSSFPFPGREGGRGVRSAGRGEGTSPETNGLSLVQGADAAVSRALAGNAKDLLALLTVPAPDGGPALCGRARAVESAVNALLPWAAARAATPATADAILSIADRLPPAEAYGPTRHLTRNLRDGRGRTLTGSALKQQGTLALLTEWCRRGGCGRCPLS